MQAKKRAVPSLIDQPIKLFIFDKEDGMAFLFAVFVLMFVFDNLLLIMFLSLIFMIFVNRLKANKPRGYIIHLFYKWAKFSKPVKYLGKQVKIRV